MEDMTVLEQIIAKLEEAKVDNNKFYVKSNKSAGTRMRKVYTEVQKLMQTEKKNILAVREEMPTKEK